MPDLAPKAAREEPLGASARMALVCFATAIVLFSYAFATAAFLLISAMLALEILLVLAAARFGLAGFAARILERHLALAAVFLRCVRLKRGPDLGFSLEQTEAPRMFEIVAALCATLNIKPPSVIWLYNGVNAHVELKGVRRGAGRTVLGVGYDLLAGLSEAEMQAVLAHEMAHSKLVQRGLSSWLMKGLRRLILLSHGLSTHLNGYRRANRRALLVEPILWTTSSLTSIAARLVATYSRQDEFDADRTAAELCGTAAMRASLKKLRPLAEICGRLPWRERVAQLQSSGGLSQWLLAEIASAGSFTANPRQTEVFNEYSTHPTPADRLAALGGEPGDDDSVTGPAALSLLSQPDAVAKKLVLQIQSVMCEQERKESRELDRWTRKLAVRTQLRPAQLLAVALIAVAALLSFGLAFAGDWSLLIVTLPPGVLGFGLFRWARYKDRVALPSPEFGALRRWKPGPNVEKHSEELERELRRTISAGAKTREKKRIAIQECYAALAACDYLKANVTARYILRELDSRCLEAMLGLSVSAAAFADHAASGAAFAAAQKRTGFATASTLWAGGWALALAGEWSRAEALLARAAVLRPSDPTLHSVLALVQARRGKLHSAIENARKACKLRPGNNEDARQLTMLLLDAGFVREAQPRLLAVQRDAAFDSELALAMVRLHLTLQQFDQAERWTNTVLGFEGHSHLPLRLGEAYELARKPDLAAKFYRQALGAAFYPEACAGLGRIDAANGNRLDAERCFLSALDTGRAVGENGLHPLACLPAVLAALINMREPVPVARAWIATVPGDSPVAPLANQSLLVYAPLRAEAEQYLTKVLACLDHRMGSLSHRVMWRDAPHDWQPAGPVRPGVQCLLT